MNIAIIGPGFKPIPDVDGGAIEHLVTSLIYENEEKKDFDIDVYTVSNEKLSDIYLTNTHIYAINDLSSNNPLFYIYKLKNLIGRVFKRRKQYIYISEAIPREVKDHYELIVVENNVGMFMSLKKRLRNANVVFHLHNDFDTVEKDYDKTSKRMCYVCENSKSVWTASNYLNDRLRSIYKGDNVRTLQNCVDKKKFNKQAVDNDFISKFKCKYHIEACDFVILYCGRIDRTKGLLELVKAVSYARNKKKIKILAVGGKWFSTKSEDKYENEIRHYVNKYGINISFSGYVDQSYIHNVYECSSVVAIPSTCAEAFGMTALEAICMGKPCIATKIGGLCEVLSDDCSILIDYNEEFIKKFASAIDELYEKPEKMRIMSANAMNQAVIFSDTKTYYDKFKELVRETL